MKRIIGSLVVVGTMAACSGGGGGGGGASSGFKGTGYLPVEIPAVSASLVSSVTVSSAGGVSASAYADRTPGAELLDLVALTENSNNGQDCYGVAANIPFLVCVVESLGINQPGTYTGKIENHTFTAVVSAINQNGYTIQAVVTKDGSLEVFNYKANAAGTKGEIEVRPEDIFPGDIPDVASMAGKTVLKWDGTTAADSTIEISGESLWNYSNGNVTRGWAFKKALVDQSAGVVDLISKAYTVSTTASANKFFNMSVYQTRFYDNKMVEVSASCSTQNNSGTIGTDCFGQNTWELNSYDSFATAGSTLVVGSLASSSYGPVFSSLVGAQLVVNGTAGGSITNDDLALPAVSGAMAAVVGAQNGSAQLGFTPVLDKSSGSADLQALMNEVLGKSFASLDSILP